MRKLSHLFHRGPGAGLVLGEEHSQTLIALASGQTVPALLKVTPQLCRKGFLSARQLCCGTSLWTNQWMYVGRKGPKCLSAQPDNGHYR